LKSIAVIWKLVLKGSTLSDIAHHLGIMTLFAIGLNTWAILSYRKHS
jgi:hypothetical protein